MLSNQRTIEVMNSQLNIYHFQMMDTAHGTTLQLSLN